MSLGKDEGAGGGETENGHHQGGADAVEKLLGDKWFFPILKAIDEFETETKDIAPESYAVAADEVTDWVFNTVFNVASADGDYSGLNFVKKRNARFAGILVGVKWCLCEAYERAYPCWNALTPKQIAKIEAGWWKGFVGEVVDITKVFAEQHTPRFREIKRTAIELAQKEGGIEEIDFYQGYVVGSGYLKRMRSQLQAAKHKRGADKQKRATVALFVLYCGEEIEKVKADLSWPEIHQLFGEFVQEFAKSLPKHLRNQSVEIEEETLTQILKRGGLKGVGKPGRRPSNETGTP